MSYPMMKKPVKLVLNFNYNYDTYYLLLIKHPLYVDNYNDLLKYDLNDVNYYITSISQLLGADIDIIIEYIERRKKDYKKLLKIALNNLIENYKFFIIIGKEDYYNKDEINIKDFAEDILKINLINNLNYHFVKLNLKMPIYILNVEKNDYFKTIDKEYTYYTQYSNEIFAVLGEIKHANKPKNKITQYTNNFTYVYTSFTLMFIFDLYEVIIKIYRYTYIYNNNDLKEYFYKIKNLIHNFAMLKY